MNSTNLMQLNLTNHEIIDITIKTVKHAKTNGFLGFGGFCASSALAINQILFDNKQINFASFNKSLAEQGHHIGHVCCLINLHDGDYFIIDSDAQFKEIEDIEHWGMLDSNDIDYQNLMQKYNLKLNPENFEEIMNFELTEEFLREHFDFTQFEMQKEILSQSLKHILSQSSKEYREGFSLKL